MDSEYLLVGRHGRHDILTEWGIADSNYGMVRPGDPGYQIREIRSWDRDRYGPIERDTVTTNIW